MTNKRKVFVTGGAGYVGSALVPKLLEKGHEVKVVDLFLYDEHVLDSLSSHAALKLVKGDIRDSAMLEKELKGYDAVIHLACISNDPSFDLDPELGRSINYTSFFGLVDAANKNRVKNFIYASSSSVYGVKDAPEVTEDLPLEPLTDYSKYKAECEKVLFERAGSDMVPTILRPATVCGYSPRLRLDLTVNILTNHAVNRGEIKVFGGGQMRPNIHIDDMTDLYCMLLELPDDKIRKKIFNAGYDNHTVMEIAETVKGIIDPRIPIKVTPTDDNRSYHVSSKKIKKELGYEAKRTVADAVRDLKTAFVGGKIPNPMEDVRYYNIKTLQAKRIK